MARMRIDGLDDMNNWLDKLIALPDEVIDNMLASGAKIVVTAQKRVGRQMGVHRTGKTLDSITAGKVSHNHDGATIKVTPVGRETVAFVNNYGAPQRGIKPRPFITEGNAQAVEPTTDAMEAVYNDYLSKIERT